MRAQDILVNGVASDQIINPDEYGFFCDYLEEVCGIVLGENKHYLIAKRLDHLLHELSLDSVGKLIDKLKNNPRPGLRERIIDAMTTNETSWFRDGYPFEILKKIILPEAAKRKAREIRIWSAACSSGQEPYSISMTIQEFLQAYSGELTFSQIVSTEISSSMLQSAREGVYDELSLSRGLSPERSERFFVAKDNQWQVKREIRERLVIKELNLMNSFALLGRFDVVFCRNVLIYFSESVKADILSRITRILQPGGYLFLGSSESLTGCTDDYEILHLCGGIVYKLINRPATQ